MSEIFRSIRRTPYQTLASVIILFLTSFLMLTFFILTTFFHGVLSYAESRPLVIAYFNNKTPEQTILQIKQKVEATGQTAIINYVSQKDAYEIYKQAESDNPILLAMVTPDILPASLEVRAKEPKFLTEIAATFKREPSIETVDFQKEDVQSLLSITSILRKITAALFIILGLISIIVLMTTTAFKIALKKDEIELFQLLGATRWYVRRPYILEGIIFGFISSSCAYGITLLIYFLNQSQLMLGFTKISNIELYGLGRYGLFVWPPSGQFFILSFVFISGFGCLIGLVGNYLAASKYIK
ncbi:MAG: cell division protein FtsX [Candidatus Roizmanbacteria bacterium]